MSNFNTLRIRQSTELFEQNIWYVYHQDGNKLGSLVKRCESQTEAKELHSALLMEEIEATILNIDASQEITAEFLEQAIEDKCSLIAAVESFFNDCSFDIEQLKPLQGEVDNFSAEVNKLQRPYVAISSESQEILLKGKADYYLTSGGKVVTFGKASVDGANTEFALMPLCHDEAQNVLAMNA